MNPLLLNRCPTENKSSHHIAIAVFFPRLSASTFEVAMVVHSSVCRDSNDKYCLGPLDLTVLCDLISIVFVCICIGVPDCAFCAWWKRERAVVVSMVPWTCILDQVPIVESRQWHIGFHSSLFQPRHTCKPANESNSTLRKCIRWCINPNCGCGCSKVCGQGQGTTCFFFCDLTLAILHVTASCLVFER